MVEDGAETYRDDLLKSGKAVELGLLANLERHGVRARGPQYVLKLVHALHKLGALGDLIVCRMRLLSAGTFSRLTPAHTHDVLGSAVPLTCSL